MSEFLDFLLKDRSANSHFLTNDACNFEPLISNQRIFISKTELNVLYYIAGYIIVNIRKNQKACNVCITATKSNSIICHSYNILTKIKAKKQKCYFFVNVKTFLYKWKEFLKHIISMCVRKRLI